MNDEVPPASGIDISPDLVEAVTAYHTRVVCPDTLRSPEQIAAFITGLEPVEPGVIPTPLRRLAPAAGRPLQHGEHDVRSGLQVVTLSSGPGECRGHGL